MGTDIHLYVEQRQADGSWKALAPPDRDLERWPRVPREGDGWVSPFWGPHGCMYEHKCYGTDDENCPNAVPEEGEVSAAGGDNALAVVCPRCQGTGRDLRWYHNRNYDVFAILTGTVRNGFGFAGVETGDGFRGITAEPRGMPDDVTETVRDHNSWDHSESWLSLPEILAFDWSQVSTHYGVIPLRLSDEHYRTKYTQSYAAWRHAEPRVAPTSYCGGVSGPGIVVLSQAEADRMLSDDVVHAGMSTDELRAILDGDGDGSRLVPSGKHHYVRVSWTATYRESAQDFLAFIDTFLKPLGDPERIRIVFGFDS